MHAPSRAVFAPSTAIVGIVRRAVYDSKSCENEKICWLKIEWENSRRFNNFKMLC